MLISSVEDYAILILDAEGRVVTWNPGTERIKGYSQSEIVGQPIQVFYTEEDNREHKSERLLQVAADQGSVEDEGWRVRKDGTQFWAHVSITALRNESGALLGFAKITADQTKRRNTQEQLRISEERFSTAFEYAAIGMALVAPDGKFLRVNRAYSDMLGYSLEELLKLDFQTITHPEDLEADLAQAQQLLRGEIDSYQMEKRYLRKNGDVVWVLLSGSLVRDASGQPKQFIAQVQDITKRRKALQTLQEQTVLLETVIDSMGNGLIVASKSEFLLFNGPARQLFGDNPGQTHPEDWPVKYGLYRSDKLTLFEAEDLPLAKAMRGVSAETEMWVKNEFSPIGTWISIVARPLLNVDGTVRGGIIVFQDVTGQKKLETELELSRAQAVSNARLSALGMMAGSIAHEINNPLGVIHGAASNLVDLAEQEKPASDLLLKNSQRILQTSERIAKIVKSLRQISREGSSDAFRNVPLSLIIEETLELCSERFRIHSVTLTKPAFDPGLQVRCREVQVEQMLLNLLQNAFDAVTENPEEKWVHIELERSGEFIKVSVIDNGPGIPQAAKPHVLEPFFTTKPVGKGTGLGLSICKTIAEDHGGRLELGEKNGNTCVSFVLPTVKEQLACN